MTGEKFCYFHMRVKDATTQKLDSAIPTVMIVEDAESAQGALMQVIDLTLKSQVSVPQSRVILRAIELAWKNVKEMQEQRKYEEEKDYRDTQRARWQEQDRKDCERKREEERINREKALERTAAMFRAAGRPLSWDKTEPANTPPEGEKVGEIHAVAEESLVEKPQSDMQDGEAETAPGLSDAQDMRTLAMSERLTRRFSGACNSLPFSAMRKPTAPVPPQP
jgi:hypothetical protein